jgi:hypothetical protein
MVTMNIGNQSYPFPQDLTLEQWSEIVKWDVRDQNSWPYILKALTGHPLEDLKKGKYEAMELGMILVSDLLNKRTETPITDPKELTFGQWVDIEVYLSFGIQKHLKDVIKVMSPEGEHNASQALWVLDRYLEFRTWLLRQFEGLFGGDEPIEEEDNEPQDPMNAAKSWYRIIVDLAGGDILKIDAVTDQPLVKVLNFLSLRKEERLAEEQRQRQQKLQHDLHLRNHR